VFIGTAVNALAILFGGVAGLLFGKTLPERFGKTLTQATSLAVLLIGLKGALTMKSDDLILVIFSLVFGSCLGEWINIEALLERLGRSIQERFAKAGGQFAKGFVTTSLIYCVGSMAIMGALQSGLEGKHETLFAKAVLDGVMSIVFASTLGIGVLASSVSVFIYQGAIVLGASFLKPFLLPVVVGQMSVVGGLLIAAIGINVMEMAKIRVGNMLPAIFMPLLWYMIGRLI